MYRLFLMMSLNKIQFLLPNSFCAEDLKEVNQHFFRMLPHMSFYTVCLYWLVVWTMFICLLNFYVGINSKNAGNPLKHQ